MQLIGAAEAQVPAFREDSGHFYMSVPRVEARLRDALGEEAAEHALAEGRRSDMSVLLSAVLFPGKSG
jgi:hypothetical protein